MSTHKVEVVRITLESHPNADRLALVHIHGWQVVVGKDEFIDGTLGVYIAPDYVVPQEPDETAQAVILPSTLEMLSRNCKLVDARHPSGEGYIKGYRIKVKKFRGEWSQGLLLRAPLNSVEGQDVMQLLKIGHYEPPIETTAGSEADISPEIPCPKFDVESLAQFNKVLHSGMEIVITEKIHGAQARFLYDGIRFHCGSKNEWKKEHPSSIWWRALETTNGLKAWLQSHPGITVYGEIYGSGVQDLSYGLKNRDIRFAIFDIWDKNRFLSYEEARTAANHLPWVPELYRGPYAEERVKNFIDGTSIIPMAGHLKEGIVIRTFNELKDPLLGRIVLKAVSNSYLERA